MSEIASSPAPADASFAAVPPALLDGACRLTHLGVIRAQGEDAAKFLHGQLTNDFSLLGNDQARLAALCSPKGRMLASFVGFKRAPDDILLLCSADVLPATLKRLSMFVLRAKVKLSDASSELGVWGLTGAAVARHAGAAGTPQAQPWALACALTSDDTRAAVRLYPADGVARALLITAADAPAPQVPGLDEAAWLWAEVRSGVARITVPVVEAFVPQMLNYESVGGVNFQKGCYPGQEVVARSQFRGTLKRRAYRVHVAQAAAPVPAGTEIFRVSDAEQPVGEIALAAAAPGGGVDAVACLTVSAVDGAALHLGSVDGPVLRIDALPYVLRDDL